MLAASSGASSLSWTWVSLTWMPLLMRPGSLTVLFSTLLTLLMMSRWMIRLRRLSGWISLWARAFHPIVDELLLFLRLFSNAILLLDFHRRRRRCRRPATWAFGCRGWSRQRRPSVAARSCPGDPSAKWAWIEVSQRLDGPHCTHDHVVSCCPETSKFPRRRQLTDQSFNPWTAQTPAIVFKRGSLSTLWTSTHEPDGLNLNPPQQQSTGLSYVTQTVQGTIYGKSPF